MKIPVFAKFVLKMVAGAGVNEVLTNIIKSTTPEDISTTRQVMTNLGKLVIIEAVSSVVVDQFVKDVEEVLNTSLGPVVPEKKIEPEPTPTQYPVGSAMSIERVRQAAQEVIHGGQATDKKAADQS